MSYDILTESKTIDPSLIEESPQFDFTFKIIVLGDYNVGKTSIIKKYINDTFDEKYQATVGLDIQFKTIIYENKVIKLQFWDTAGQERYKSFIPSYFRGAIGVIIVYDVTDKESFDNINTWIEFVKNNCWKNAQIIFIGNKIDMFERREVKEHQCIQLAENYTIPLVECSANTGLNINAAIMFLIKHIFIRMRHILHSDTELLKSVLGISIEAQKVNFGSKSNYKCTSCNKF